MFYFILGIIFTVLIFIVFRYYTVYKVNTLQAIVVNYFVCVITGIVTLGYIPHLEQIHFSSFWVKLSIILGGIFIFTFYLVAYSTQKVGITISSLASKMSLVIPVVFSIWIFENNLKKFTCWNYIGIGLTFMAILLTSFKKNRQKENFKNLDKILLPLAVLLLSGAIDTSINFINGLLDNSLKKSLFPILTFSSAALVGTVILLFKQQVVEMKSILGGIMLGIPNYFSIYFLLKSLSFFKNDGAFVYPIFNMSVIFLSSLLAAAIFKEKFSLLNKIGILIAILAIYLISYQEILAYLV